MSDVTVAAVQMDAQPGAAQCNLAHAAAMVDRAAAQGARLVVLSELFSSGYEYTDRVYAWPEPLDGPTATWLIGTARRLGLHLVGSFPARIDGRPYIVAMLVAPDGRTWIYHKVHVAMWENCYEVEDSGGRRMLLTLGARDALRVPRAAGTRYRIRCPMMGRSCIIDGDGARLAGAPQEGEAVLVARVHPGAADRDRLPTPPAGRWCRRSRPDSCCLTIPRSCAGAGTGGAALRDKYNIERGVDV